MDINLHKKCRELIRAYKTGKLGQTVMPEDSNPGFSENGENDKELRLAYFTLPMALNYQRNSYTLWESALKTFEDPETNFVFDISSVSGAPVEKVRKALL